jgi:hypothetical protein
MKQSHAHRNKPEGKLCNICKNEPQRTAGMCPACYSWWNRVKYLDAPALSAYLERAERTALRTSARVGTMGRVKTVRGAKVLPFVTRRRKA